MRDDVLPLRSLGHLEISAASGLLFRADQLHVVADDELSMDSYALPHLERTGRVLLLPGSLPEAHAERKARKPDFESLVWLEAELAIALGSGSTKARQRGVLLRWDRSTLAFAMETQTIDLGPLYDALGATCPGLNIEGATVLRDGRLRLLQRGAAGVGNAVIDLALPSVLASIRRSQRIDAAAILRVTPATLGALDDVPLAFTDACTVDDDGITVLVTAAAEDTANAYDDGACIGSVVARLNDDGTLAARKRLGGPYKVEGLVATRAHGLMMVADPDDRATRAPVLAAAATGLW